MPDARATLETALTGTYAFERELGRGGMATVYLARDLKHDRLVAFKVLEPEHWPRHLAPSASFAKSTSPLACSILTS